MIELQFQYSPIFSLQVQHNYYTKSLKRDLKIVPTKETMEFIKHSGLIVKTTEDGMLASYDVYSPEQFAQFLERNETGGFTFFLVTTNYFFNNLTDMATESMEKVFYFDSLNSQKKEEEQFLMHQGEFVNQADSLPKVEGDISYELKSKKATLELKDFEGNVVVSDTVDGMPKYVFASEKLSQGFYSIYENKKETYRFVLVKEAFRRTPIVGVVSIPLSKAYRTSLLETLRSGQKISTKQYNVHFETRSTFWKYYFVSRYKLPLEKSAIVTNEEGVEFAGPSKVKLSNGDTAYLFESKSPLPLKEIPQFHFKLSKDKKRANGESYLNRLPTPPPDMIKPESRAADAKVYSELIVYV